MGGALWEATPTQQLLQLLHSSTEEGELSQHMETEDLGCDSLLHSSAVNCSHVVIQPEYRQHLRQQKGYFSLSLGVKILIIRTFLS